MSLGTRKRFLSYIRSVAALALVGCTLTVLPARAEDPNLGNQYSFSNVLTSGKAAQTVVYGRPTDQAFVGDWNGDGKDTLALRRGNRYYVKNSISGGNADKVVVYGKASDQVVVGDWNGDGTDTFGVRRGKEYFLKNSLSGGNADVDFFYGWTSDTVLVGDWNADRRDTLAVRRPYEGSTATSGGSPAVSTKPVSGGTCPSGYPVKGNVNKTTNEKIYHVPGDSYYDRTNPEECFRSAADAASAGYRAPRN